ncbi:MAG TPA: hypothetical protein V6D00_10675, partial [Pantanalinema sp.]
MSGTKLFGASVCALLAATVGCAELPSRPGTPAQNANSPTRSIQQGGFAGNQGTQVGVGGGPGGINQGLGQTAGVVGGGPGAPGGTAFNQGTQVGVGGG